MKNLIIKEFKENFTKMIIKIGLIEDFTMQKKIIIIEQSGEMLMKMIYSIIKEFIRIKFNKIQGLKDKFIKEIIQKSKIDDDSVKDFIEETKIKELVRIFIE